MAELPILQEDGQLSSTRGAQACGGCVGFDPVMGMFPRLPLRGPQSRGSLHTPPSVSED